MTYKWNGCCVCVCSCVRTLREICSWVLRCSSLIQLDTLNAAFHSCSIYMQIAFNLCGDSKPFFPVCYSDRSIEKPIVLNFPMRSIWYGSFGWATRIECRWNAQALAVERTTAVNVSNIGGLVSVSHKWIGPNRNGRLKAVWEERRWTNVHIYTYIKSRNRKWKTQFHQYVIH